MLLSAFFIMALATLHGATGAKILAILTTPSISHHIWNRELMRGLAAKGHQVTVFSPDPEKKPLKNHRDIVLEGAYFYKEVDAAEFQFEEMSSLGPVESLRQMYGWAFEMCKQGFGTKGMETVMKMNNETFDLMIVEVVCFECYLGLVHHFNYPPVLAVTAFSSPPWASTILGNPNSPAYVPDLINPFTDKMSFYQRFSNTLMYLATLYIRNYEVLPAMDELVRKHFGESTPSVSEIQRHISLIMVNIDPSIDYPRPLVPNMIPVGGMHIKPSQTLPEDLKKFIGESPHGVIFFSLGSNVRSDKLGKEKIQALLEAFKELPQRILWKWESDVLPGQPPNVKLGKWLPQSDILGHPNVRLFITHGGLLSFQEAVYRGVPVVGMPFIADQHINMMKAIDHGVGEKLNYDTLTKESALEVITKVLNTKSYRANMKKLSEVFRDQPQTPLERAIFWTEYVIRHKGAPHLRSAAADMPWYQYLLLDVVAVLALGILVTLLTVYFAVRAIVRRVVGCKTKKTKQQ